MKHSHTHTHNYLCAHGSMIHNNQSGNNPDGHQQMMDIQMWSFHTQEHLLAMKRGEGPFLLHGWALRTRCSVTEVDTEGHIGCDSADGKRPEQDDPQTQRVVPGCQGPGRRWSDC